MRNARSTVIAVLLVICILKVSDISGLPTSTHLAKSVSPIDSVIGDLIFNAQYDQAIRVANKALDQLEGDSYSRSQLLLRLSEIYIYTNNLGKAAEILHDIKIKKNASDKTDDQVEFLYYLDMGMLLNKTGQIAESGKWMKKSASILNRINNPNHSDAARLYCLLGKHSYETRDSINAIRYFKQSLIFHSQGSLQEKMANLTYLSYLQLVYMFSGNKFMALLTELQADSIYSTIQNKKHPSLIDYYLNLSFIYTNYGLNTQKAEKSLLLASIIMNSHCSLGDPRYALLYCYNGQLAYQAHDSEKALGYFRQAETYLEKNQNLSPYMYLLFFDLANTYYFYINDYHKAIEYYMKVINNSNQWLYRAHINSRVLSSYCFLELGDTAKAISYMKNGISAAEHGSRVSGREKTYTYRCLAGLYLNIGEEKLAHHYFQEAYAKANTYDVEWDLKADIITNMANYHRDFGDIHTALNLYQTAIDKAFYDPTVFTSRSQFCDEIELIEILNNKGYALLQLYEKQFKNSQHLKDALNCQEIAIRLIEKRIVCLDNESSEYNWLALLQTTFNNAVLYSTLLYNHTLDLRYADIGLKCAEKSRMMIILVVSQDKKIKKYLGVPDSLIQKETRLHNEILNLQNQLYLCERRDFNSAQQKLISGKIASAQIERDHLKSIFESNYNHYFDLKYNLHVLGLNQIQKLLLNDQVLLEYQLLENELITITISSDHVSMRVDSYSGHERQSIIKFYNSISQNPSNKDPVNSYKGFVKTAHCLYSWLIEPIQEEIKNKRLIIIPHNELNLIPFELLISKLPSTIHIEDYRELSFLIKKCPVSYGYSATLLFEETAIKPVKKAAFFLPDYIHLQGTQEEVNEAHNLIGGDLFSGTEANESRFKLSAADYKILHIASHTFMDNQIPTLSSLVLNSDSDSINDGLLYSYELYQLHLNAQLIVLSGCETGMGKLQQGEGLLSLSRSFLYSGVRSVAFTLWPQADKSGAEIVIGFYKGIKKNKRLEDALQFAKLDYLSHADPAKTHPFYWSGFVIAGKTDPLLLNNYFPEVTIFLILIFASIGGLIYRKFKT